MAFHNFLTSFEVCLFLRLQYGHLVQNVHLSLLPGQSQSWRLVEEMTPACANPDSDGRISPIEFLLTYSVIIVCNAIYFFVSLDLVFSTSSNLIFLACVFVPALASIKMR